MKKKIKGDVLKVLLESLALGKDNTAFNCIFFNKHLQELYKQYNVMMFSIKGVVYRNISLIKDTIHLGMNVRLIKESDNQYDANAIRLESDSGVQFRLCS